MRGVVFFGLICRQMSGGNAAEDEITVVGILVTIGAGVPAIAIVTEAGRGYFTPGVLAAGDAPVLDFEFLGVE